MRILFWNTHKNKGINPYIASLVLDNEIDILALSEYDANIDELNAMFKDNNQRLIKCNTLGCDRIDVWSSYVNIKSGIQEKYYPGKEYHAFHLKIKSTWGDPSARIFQIRVYRSRFIPASTVKEYSATLHGQSGTESQRWWKETKP